MKDFDFLYGISFFFTRYLSFLYIIFHRLLLFSLLKFKKFKNSNNYDRLLVDAFSFSKLPVEVFCFLSLNLAFDASQVKEALMVSLRDSPFNTTSLFIMSSIRVCLVLISGFSSFDALYDALSPFITVLRYFNTFLV